MDAPYRACAPYRRAQPVQKLEEFREYPTIAISPVYEDIEQNSAEVDEDASSTHSEKSSRATSLPSWLSTRLQRVRTRRSWTYGLYVGLYASTAVLISNIILLIVALSTHGGVVDGIGTIAKGERRTITRISTIYHILINILSTILLTSSNYAMQVLCAPTRKEIDKAHRKGKDLEIGIMSMRNLINIDKKRALLWLLLMLSSTPLHLLYNSCVFEVTAAQYYEVSFIYRSELNASEARAWTKLDNAAWMASYASVWTPGYGDLALVVDQVAFRVEIESNWTYSLQGFQNFDSDWKICSWPTVSLTDTTWPIEMRRNGSQMVPVISPQIKVVTDSTNYTSHLADFPKIQFPLPRTISIQQGKTIMNTWTFCNNSGWQVPGSGVHVEHGRAKTIPSGSRVQVAIWFLTVVIVCNISKIIGISMAIKMCSATHIVTVGDAVASFLETSEQLMEGKCTVETSRSVLSSIADRPIPWQANSKKIMFILGGKRLWSLAVITISSSLIFVALTMATSSPTSFSDWGTSSHLIIQFTTSSFTARGSLFVAFIANFPQFCLSLLYFSINRICTSMAFAREWNNYAIYRQGLRVTAPSGQQRDTYFLQLPYRWAIPLNVMSGLLHWLLSQCLFLVRREMRKGNGEIYPGSICACGYSVISLLIFTLVFLALLVGLLALLFRSVDVKIPPAKHSSLMISAACHPPSEDREVWLEKIGWGVTIEAGENFEGHCSFSSLDVGELKEGMVYT